MKIAIINYEGGNVGSVFRAIEFVSKDNRNLNIYLAQNKNDIVHADRLIIPGQGAMPQTMRTIESNNMAESIINCYGKKPFLGICVGMQILMERSEEGSCTGLGLIKGQVVSFNTTFQTLPNTINNLKIPHLGWSKVVASLHPIWEGIAPESDFYFAHSFFCQIDDPGLCIGKTLYGIEYPSVISGPLFFATQFHPEKSGTNGLKLLKNFLVKDF